MTEGASGGAVEVGASTDGALRPRKMELATLVQVLVGEHSEMKDALAKARGQSQRRDFGALETTMKGMDSLFRQHIVDEESTVLRLLIARLGVKGAEKEIAVFRQHAPIYQLMRKIGEFASMSAPELEASSGELEDLFGKHAAAEEDRVFPRAKALSAER